MTIEYIERTAVLHRVVVHNGLAFVSGIVADDGDAPMEIQAAQVIDTLEARLKSVGSNLDAVLSATVFLTDMSHKKALNDVWKVRFGAEKLPARATIGVSDLDGPYLVEITAIAACTA